MNRRIVTVDHGILRIDQRIRIRSEMGTDVSGPACIYAHVNIRKGAIAYLQDETRIPAPRRFAIFLPPFCVVQASLERCEVVTSGIAFRPPARHALPLQPFLIHATTTDGLPTSVDQAVDRIRDAERAIDIGRSRHPLPVALKAKTILDAEYGSSLPVGRVAARLRVSAAVLSRAFKKSYGLPPVGYRHHLRVMDALLQLAEGAVPAGVFQDVGFDDLSRFYKILRKVACAPPGSYRPRRSKNAKT